MIQQVSHDPVPYAAHPAFGPARGTQYLLLRHVAIDLIDRRCYHAATGMLFARSDGSPIIWKSKTPTNGIHETVLSDEDLATLDLKRDECLGVAPLDHIRPWSPSNPTPAPGLSAAKK